METHNIALGYCPKCNEAMVTENGVPKCINCVEPVRPKHIVKPPPVTYVPTDSEFKQYIKDAAIGAKMPEVTKLVTKVTTEKTAQDALFIMRHLPMPDNEKEFRQIKKIIKQLEKLVGENK